MTSREQITIVLAVAVATSAAAVAFTREAAPSPRPESEIRMSCGPSQRAVVRRVDDDSRVSVECVDAATLPEPEAHESALAPVDAGRPLLLPASTGVVHPISHAAAAPAAVTPAPAPARRAPASRADPRSSVKKRVLIVGGVAGAGAGVGAAIGGRKGALIGAAIGGGGAAIVDQIKHR